MGDARGSGSSPWDECVRVRPCASNSVLFQSISEAPPHALMHCILDSTCYATLHHPLHPHLHTCCLCLFVYLFVYLCYWCMCCLFVCLSVSPSRLFLLIDGQWTGAKSNCTCSIRRGLSRRLRSSLLLKSSPSTSRDHPLVT